MHLLDEPGKPYSIRITRTFRRWKRQKMLAHDNALGF